MLFIMNCYITSSQTQSSDIKKKDDLFSMLMRIDESGRGSPLSEPIWFFIDTIEKIDVTVSAVNTDHTIKKLVYNEQKRCLSLIGKKLKNADCAIKSDLTTYEISQAIVPFKNPEDRSDETDFFCKQLQEKYPRPVVITLKLFYPKGTAIKRFTHDPYIDNFPNAHKPILVYYDPITFLASSEKSDQTDIAIITETISTKTPKPITIEPSSISNKIVFFCGASMIISISCLITCLLLYHRCMSKIESLNA